MGGGERDGEGEAWSAQGGPKFSLGICVDAVLELHCAVRVGPELRELRDIVGLVLVLLKTGQEALDWS